MSSAGRGKIRPAAQPCFACCRRLVMGDDPVVVHLHDLVTGAMAVVRAEAIGTVLDVWFPTVTADARAMIDRLEARALAGDWWMVEEYARYLELQVRPI